LSPRRRPVRKALPSAMVTGFEVILFTSHSESMAVAMAMAVTVRARSPK
jgi:hypothetical protein